MKSLNILRFTIFAATACLTAACAQQKVDQHQLKEELKREILAELEADRKASEPGERQEVPRSSVALAVPTGRVTGRVFFRNRGLSDCQVRLIRLASPAGNLGFFANPRETTVFETVTESDGTYRFEHLPVGAYRIKWHPKEETGWIRRLSDEPDLIVEDGRTATADDFHAGRPILDSD